eukprot:TRINITY_DN38053_c0_g6_i1.p1 TRINITY_DN38053_c0_g6~~TRINITY_DN38053_c0_g6_i1.p1  ORF type:complete len:315 (+),score=45.96 TRINITY_DN38053_c0_g6_i1:65-1009(+)
MSAITASFELPRRMAEEVLRQYADVLRVGRMRVGSETVSWDTQVSPANQLQSFSSVVTLALQRLPELNCLGDEVLAQSAYLLCKVFSINYALVEVLDFIRQRIGPMCSIKTCGDDGRSLVDYSVEVGSETGRLRAAMTWKLDGNVVQCSTKRPRPKVRGTLSRLETEFPVPPEFGFAPIYQLHSRLPGDSKSTLRLLPTLGCLPSRTHAKKQRPPATITMEAPLCGDCMFLGGKKLLSPKSSGTVSTCDGETAPLDAFDVGVLGSSDDDTELVPLPTRTLTARTVRQRVGGRLGTKRSKPADGRGQGQAIVGRV